MLQQKYLSSYDFSEIHSITIDQTPEKIYSLIDEIDLRESKLINFLFAIRGIGNGEKNVKTLLNGNFILLEEQINSEIIFGLVGQFWKSKGNLQKMTVDEFCHFDQENFLKATWSFKVTPRNDNSSLLETETRIQCIGSKAHRKFRTYWFFIRPFSGLIRMEILKIVKRKAEKATGR